MVLGAKGATLVGFEVGAHRLFVVREVHELSRSVLDGANLFKNRRCNDEPKRRDCDGYEVQVDSEVAEGRRDVAKAPKSLRVGCIGDEIGLLGGLRDKVKVVRDLCQDEIQNGTSVEKGFRGGLLYAHGHLGR